MGLSERDRQLLALILFVSIGLTMGRLDWPWYQYFFPILCCFFHYLIFKSKDFRSPLISGVSLALLTGVGSIFWVGIVSLLTILGKRLLRWKNRHLFNPTNLSIVASLFLFPNEVWIRPGQWGSDYLLAGLFLFLGISVAGNARSLVSSLSFISFFSVLVILRATILGDPMEIQLLSLSQGSLLLFAFFMLNDPKTNPFSRLGKIVFGFVIAGLTFYIQFFKFMIAAPFFSLTMATLLVPLLNRIYPGEKYLWKEECLKPQLSVS